MGDFMGSIKDELQEREIHTLSPFAACSVNTKGRQKPAHEDDLRTEYQRDRDRILHCNAFRRLMNKTQCFISPDNDHFRTRLTHTLEVAQISRTLARALKLNEDLTEAIALGHDLGHTPFGHMGERSLNRLMPEGFRHREQSLRVVDCLENKGEGLNLTWEVRDGILHHSGQVAPQTLEGQCVCKADRIAYINHDIDDAIRAGVLSRERLPQSAMKLLGSTRGERIDTLVHDVIEQSSGKDRIVMSELISSAMDELRSFLFDTVYMRPEALRMEEKANRLIETLFFYVLKHPDVMSEDYILRCYRDGVERSCCDFIAGMTDDYAERTFNGIFLPI